MISVINLKAHSGFIYSAFAAVSFALTLVLARISYDHGSNVETVMLVRFTMLTVILMALGIAKKQ